MRCLKSNRWICNTLCSIIWNPLLKHGFLCKKSDNVDAMKTLRRRTSIRVCHSSIPRLIDKHKIGQHGSHDLQGHQLAFCCVEHWEFHTVVTNSLLIRKRPPTEAVRGKRSTSSCTRLQSSLMDALVVSIFTTCAVRIRAKFCECIREHQHSNRK